MVYLPKMEQENKLIESEDDNHIEALLQRPFIKEERDIPEYVDINSFSEIKSKSQDVTKIFRCTQCSNKYSKIEYLTIHTAVHAEEMVCPLCCEIFLCRKQLREHINCHIKHKMNDDKKVIYSCTYCPKSFNTRKQHTIHLRVHTNERPHKCKICGEGFKQLGALKDHRVTHTKEKRYVCEICKGAFTTASSLKRHKRRIHERGRSMDCTICNVKFYNKADYNTHRSCVHPHIGYKRTCPLCSAVFYSRPSYNTHKQVHNDDLPKNKKLFVCYVCSLCGEETNNLKIFMEHRRCHLCYTDYELKQAIKLKSFPCKFCPIVYKSKQCLFNHMDLHKDKGIKCNLCHSSSTYLGLAAHKRRVHQILNCRMCNAVIKGRSNIYYHYKKHHATNLRKNYQCNICGKKSKLKTMLKWHYKLKHQTNVKNFKCGLCEKRFVTQYAIMRHKKKVHKLGVKFKCFKCALTLKTTKEMKMHKSSHTNEETGSKKTVVKTPKHFRCKVCKKFFQCAKNYEIHASLNTCVRYYIEQGRLHVCEFCKKTYSKADRLKRHVEVHHPRKETYWCQYCEQAFGTQSEYGIHSSLHIMKIEGEENVVQGVDSSDFKSEIKMES